MAKCKLSPRFYRICSLFFPFFMLFSSLTPVFALFSWGEGDFFETMANHDTASHVEGALMASSPLSLPGPGAAGASSDLLLPGSKKSPILPMTKVQAPLSPYASLEDFQMLSLSLEDNAQIPEEQPSSIPAQDLSQEERRFWEDGPKTFPHKDLLIKTWRYIKENETWCHRRCRDLLFGPGLMLPDNGEFLLRTARSWCQWLLAKKFRRRMLRDKNHAHPEDLEILMANDSTSLYDHTSKYRASAVARMRNDLMFIEILKNMIQGYYHVVNMIYRTDVEKAPT